MEHSHNSDGHTSWRKEMISQIAAEGMIKKWFEMCIALCLFSLRYMSQQAADLLGFPWSLTVWGKEILKLQPLYPAREEKRWSHCSTRRLSVHSGEEKLLRDNCEMYRPKTHSLKSWHNHIILEEFFFFFLLERFHYFPKAYLWVPFILDKYDYQ